MFVVGQFPTAKKNILQKVGKCRVEKLSRWDTVLMGKCWMGNRLLRKCRGGKLSGEKLLSRN